MEYIDSIAKIIQLMLRAKMDTYYDDAYKRCISKCVVLHNKFSGFYVLLPCDYDINSNIAIEFTWCDHCPGIIYMTPLTGKGGNVYTHRYETHIYCAASIICFDSFYNLP